jgi:hypothetical protein
LAGSVCNSLLNATAAARDSASNISNCRRAKLTLVCVSNTNPSNVTSTLSNEIGNTPISTQVTSRRRRNRHNKRSKPHRVPR